MKLVKRVKRYGAPLITIVLSGRPLIFGEVLELSNAVIAAWLPGTEGAGVADVLFGDYKPTGKLPFTWPASMDQVPCHADDQPPCKPQFAYGSGLTY
jgi:beta-glucosidase